MVRYRRPDEHPLLLDAAVVLPAEGDHEFWSSYYRPIGGLFYKSFYALWGFHPLPFRIAAMLLLAVNFVLLAVVVWQLTGSRWSALIGLLAVGIDPAFGLAYFNTGNIYDILAYTLFWGGFAGYVRIRQRGRLPGWFGLALLFCLFAAALEAKEIAVSLPVAVALYELLWHPPAAFQPTELWRWIKREGRFAAIGGLAGAAYIAGKRYGPDSLWLNPAYRPHYSLQAYFESLAHYLQQLIFKPVSVTALQMAMLLAAMLAIAAISRRRCLLWGVGFIAAGVLPLAFIPARGGAAYLVPSVAWAVYVGGLLDWLVERIAGRRLWLRSALQVLLFVLLAIKLAPWQRRGMEMQAHAAFEIQGTYRRYVEQIHALIPAPRKGARILLLSDAAGRDDYDVFFAIRLFYGDPSLDVSRMKGVDPRAFDYVLDWRDGRFVLEIMPGRGARFSVPADF